jgi:hypothetical protein
MRGCGAITTMNGARVPFHAEIERRLTAIGLAGAGTPPHTVFPLVPDRLPVKRRTRRCRAHHPRSPSLHGLLLPPLLQEPLQRPRIASIQKSARARGGQSARLERHSIGHRPARCKLFPAKRPAAKHSRRNEAGQAIARRRMRPGPPRPPRAVRRARSHYGRRTERSRELETSFEHYRDQAERVSRGRSRRPRGCSGSTRGGRASTGRGQSRSTSASISPRATRKPHGSPEDLRRP